MQSTRLSAATIGGATIGGATLEEYGGAPHGPFFTEKDQANRDLLTFIG